MLDERIEKLADKLGVTVEYLWEILLEQAFISAVHTSIFLVVFIVGTVLLYKKANSIEPLFERETAMGLMYGIIFFTVCMSAVMSYEIISGFFNPEYWALKQVLK